MKKEKNMLPSSLLAKIRALEIGYSKCILAASIEEKAQYQLDNNLNKEAKYATLRASKIIVIYLACSLDEIVIQPEQNENWEDEQKRLNNYAKAKSITIIRFAELADGISLGFHCCSRSPCQQRLSGLLLTRLLGSYGISPSRRRCSSLQFLLVHFSSKHTSSAKFFMEFSLNFVIKYIHIIIPGCQYITPLTGQ